MKVEYPAVTPGMQREQVKPLHAAYVTKEKVRHNIIQEVGRAVVPEPKLKRVKQVGEDGVGWAVVPEPPFLSRPSSTFFFFCNSRSDFVFFFFPSNGMEGGYAAGCCARGLTCVAGASVVGGCVSHSVLCRLSVLRLVGAAHRAAVDLTIRDIPVWLWLGYRS